VAFGSADEFYFFSRTCLVKDEKYFDRFDKAFGPTSRNCRISTTSSRR
jgi:uncharacterized protein with von Willebrand factor type A (vWA) domain